LRTGLAAETCLARRIPFAIATSEADLRGLSPRGEAQRCSAFELGADQRIKAPLTSDDSASTRSK
jgi:hypothetical protein